MPLNFLLVDLTMKGHGAVKTQSSDGEIHVILTELGDSSNSTSDLNETQIREIMRAEAQKPLHLKRESE